MSGPDYLEYKSPCKKYALAFSEMPGQAATPTHSRAIDHNLAPFPSNLRLAVGSYSETSSENNVTVIGLATKLSPDADSHFHSGDDADPSDFVPIAKAKTPYPVTKVEFAPISLTSKLQGNTSTASSDREMLATTSDCLRLWDFVPPDESTQSPSTGFVGRQQNENGSLVERSALSNSKSDYTAPLTSFCWSTVQPSSVITSSIDTTCTIWDISTNQAITQLISHDREVFDVAWAPNSKDVFASVGADGSVRSFDLRQLDHSTILYESPSVDGSRLRGSPLLRLAFNPTDPNSVAVIHADSPVVTILDVRSPGLAVAELRSHASAVNGIAWQGGLSGNGSPVNGYTDYAETGSALLASVSDDCQVLLWNLRHPNTQGGGKQALPRQYGLANSAASLPAPIDNVVWGSGREYIGIAMGNTVRCMRV